jgi:hypothetical protein
MGQYYGEKKKTPFFFYIRIKHGGTARRRESAH